MRNRRKLGEDGALESKSGGVVGLQDCRLAGQPGRVGWVQWSQFECFTVRKGVDMAPDLNLTSTNAQQHELDTLMYTKPVAEFLGNATPPAGGRWRG